MTKKGGLPRRVDGPKGANLILKAIDVLDMVSRSPGPPRLTDVVNATGLTTGTAYRILETLAARRMLRRDEDSRTYRLGSRFLQMAREAWEDYDLRAAAAPELDALFGEHGHILMVSVLVDDNLIVIDRRHARGAPRVPLPIGTSLALHCTASGKAVLAASEPARLSNLDLVAVTANTITEPTVLKAHIELAASNRFAIDDEESSIGVRGCAAPILDGRGRPLGAISLSGPASALSLARLREIGPMLAEAGERISWNLGFSPPQRWSDLEVARGSDDVTRVGTTTAFVGSNPTWHARRRTLFWSDRTAATLRFVADGGSEGAIALPARAQAVVEHGDGLILLLTDGIYRLDIDTHDLARLTTFTALDPREVCLTGRSDARGRLWFTTTDRTLTRAGGSLWRVNADLSVERIKSGLLFPMGIAWSPDNMRLYYSDGPRREVYKADFDVESGQVGEPDVFVRTPEGSGRPSGLAVDRDGFVWCVQSEGWRVVRYSPAGHQDRVIHLPVSRPLDCTFGGADLRSLYVTSAKLGLSERRLAELPLSGAVIAVRTDTAGLAAHATSMEGRTPHSAGLTHLSTVAEHPARRIGRRKG